MHRNLNIYPGGHYNFFLSLLFLQIWSLLAANSSRYNAPHSSLKIYSGQKQRCRWDFKSGWASSNVVGTICLLVVIWLTELPNSGWAKAHPAHSLAALLCPVWDPEFYSCARLCMHQTLNFITLQYIHMS